MSTPRKTPPDPEIAAMDRIQRAWNRMINECDQAMADLNAEAPGPAVERVRQWERARFRPELDELRALRRAHPTASTRDSRSRDNGLPDPDGVGVR